MARSAITVIEVNGRAGRVDIRHQKDRKSLVDLAKLFLLLLRLSVNTFTNNVKNKEFMYQENELIHNHF